MTGLELDHLVIGAETLEQGVSWIRDRLGVEMPVGGKHPLMGTHNHLMALGSSCFLEVIAIDPEASSPGRPRWYGLDDPAVQRRLSETPVLIAWVLRTSDIVAAVKASSLPSGEIVPVTRGVLSWRLTMPQDGSLPGGGVVPHLIEWDGGARPWESMADLGFSLDELVLTTAKADWLSDELQSLRKGGLECVSVKQGQEPHLSARLKGPDGKAFVI